MTDGLRTHLDDGEALRYEADLRTGGPVGITDERLLVADDGVVSVPLENVHEVEIQDFDWFLGLLSLVLVGFGVASIPRHVLGGLVFAAAGVASLYLTYRKRNRVAVYLHAGAKPISFHLDDTEEFRRRFGEVVARFEARDETTNLDGESAGYSRTNR